MQITLKYGHDFRRLFIPDKAEVSVLEPSALPPRLDFPGLLDRALERSLAPSALADILRGQTPRSAAIAVPDETRPTPVKTLLPHVLKRLHAALPYLDPSDVTIIIAGGLHSPAGPEACERIVPARIAPGCRVVAHDARNSRMLDFGRTSRGTPVRINAEFAQADLRMVIGQIDPHQFVGFTGGAKGAVVGCASAETIERSHSLLLDENSQVGRLGGNPAREDMNEAGRLVGVHLGINVVLDPQQRVVWLGAGEPEAVLDEGAGVCAALYGVSISEKFDMAVASCGGHPKDICLYQAQKGLNHASMAVKPGGKILLLAACPDGVGDEAYLRYVCQFATAQEVLEDFRRIGFKMGAHKAYLFGRTLSHFDVAVASELDPGALKSCLLRSADPDTVVREWVEGFEGRPRMAVIPSANTTYFYTQ